MEYLRNILDAINSILFLWKNFSILSFFRKVPSEIRSAFKDTLHGISVYAENVDITVSLKKKESGTVVNTTYFQKLKNISNKEKIISFEIEKNNRKEFKKNRSFFAGETYAPISEGNNIVYNISIPPNGIKECKANWEFEYPMNDSNIFLSYKPGIDYSILIRDEENNYDIGIEYIGSLSNLNTKVISNNNGKYLVLIKKGYLPSSGILLKWRAL